jgi:hypothetical protein
MIAKNRISAIFIVIFLSLFFIGQLAAQMFEMTPVHRFRKVMIPLELQAKKSVLPKGEYDLEFLRIPNPLSYYLRIMKKGKILHLIQGKEFPYDNSSVIPKKPTLKMSKNKDEKLLLLVFESGSDSLNYANLRASYQLEYIED